MNTFFRLRFVSFYGCGALFVLVLLSGCFEDPETVVVPDNPAPPDTLVGTVAIQNYINKTYINVIGRKPEAQEFSADFALLASRNMHPDDRRTFVNRLLLTSEHLLRLYEASNEQLLNGVDSFTIANEIQIFNVLKQNPQAAAFLPSIEKNLMMLGGLQTARADLIARRIVLWQVHELMVANSLYENINMGAFNFTLSLWESFLRRAPTEAEHRDAMLAYDGQPQVLFGVQVRDRFELVNVFVQSQAYAEGMVRNAFLFYLYREPTQPEILKGLLAYNTNRNYLDVEAYVLASNDYSLR